jgi:type 1 fimbria pilin
MGEVGAFTVGRDRREASAHKVRRACATLPLLALIVMRGASGAPAAGTCTSPNFPIVATIGAVSVPRNLALGQTIPGATVTVNLPVDCNAAPGPQSGPSVWRWSNRNGTPNLTLVPGYTDVYTDANMASGIGLRVVTFAGAGNSFMVNGSQLIFGLGPLNLNGSSVVQARFELVKIAASPATGTFTQPGGTGIHGTIWINSTEPQSALDIRYTINQSQVAACSVTTPDVAVTLPPVTTSAFQGVNSIAGTRSFTLGLNCEAGANVMVSMTDATTLANTSDALTLAPASTASGIGIQVLGPTGTPIHFAPGGYAYNDNVNVIHSAIAFGTRSGSTPITLRARYVQTASTVRSGTVSALAYLTLFYQ